MLGIKIAVMIYVLVARKFVMKGIILAGGKGSRLYPSTMAVSKQLLPVYDKPLIYYPISTMMLAGVKDILLICNPDHVGQFHNLLGDGSRLGVSIHYAIQSEPDGIPNAFIIAKHFIGDDDSLLVLGDNIIFGTGLPLILRDAINSNVGCTIFTHHVANPEQFGVLSLDASGIPESIIEKPKAPKSNLAITGIYALSNDAVQYSKDLQPSPRGETEIVDLINIYLGQDRLSNVNLGRGFAWFDTGTHGALLEASQFVETIETRQGQKIACPEEIAFINGWISPDDLHQIVEDMPTNSYRLYLENLINIGNVPNSFNLNYGISDQSYLVCHNSQ